MQSQFGLKSGARFCSTNASMFDGLYVLRTNSKLPFLSVALAYRQLWRVEAIFRLELDSSLRCSER